MGGGTIRAASKFAATIGDFRRIAAEHLPVSSSRKAFLAAEDVKLVASNSEVVVPNPFPQIEDWVFAGGEGESVAASAGEPMPRVVFGGVPTLKEAKEATSELTVALQKTYLTSPNSVGYKDSVEAHSSSTSSSHLDKQIGETKASVVMGSAVPAPAIMAFKLLNENSVAQSVVASIASDPNVWNAVSQNNELQDFLRSQMESSFGDTKLVANSDCSSVKSSDESSEPANGFMEVLQEIKSSAVDVMSNLSDYFQSLFVGRGVNGIFVNSNGTARLSAESLMEGSFMGLAVMAILVILFKRA